MGRECSTYKGDEMLYNILIEKPERERPLGRHRSKCKVK